MEDLSDISNSQLLRVIDEWVHSKRDGDLLKRRLIDGVRYEPLSEEFYLSVRQTKKIVRQYLTVLVPKVR